MFPHFVEYIKKRLLIIIGVIITSILKVGAINTVVTGFDLPVNQLKTIVAHDVCKKVWNTSAVNKHFIATKTSMEWTNFYSNHPSDLVVRDCNVTCASLYKSGNTTSGLYTVDIDGSGPLPSMNAYCDMTNDEGGWTRVFRHNLAGGYFSGVTTALSSNTTDPNNDKYSILDLLENLRSLNRFTFRIYWPEDNKRNIWSQFNNPTKDTPNQGYVPISLDASSNFWHGLEKNKNSFGKVSGTSPSLIDGSVGHSNWWYSIGAYQAHSGAIPGSGDLPSSSVVNEVHLYVHDNGLKPMSCQHIIELGEAKGDGVYTIYPDQKNAISVWCNMSIEDGGWTLFYANAANAGMAVKKSFTEHRTDKSGITVTSANYTDANTVGFVDDKLFKGATSIMAKEEGNWAQSDFAILSFENPQSFSFLLDSQLVREDAVCSTLNGADSFHYKTSAGADYYFDQMMEWTSSVTGVGWYDCHPSPSAQTNASDVENHPRHFLYSINLSEDGNRVRGVAGFNNGSSSVIARYFLKEKLEKPKNCMDIMLSGQSVGDGIYTIYPKGVSVSVECDMTTFGGGWTKIWHGYPIEAIANDTTSEVYSRANGIQFNQIRVEGVNLPDEHIVDFTKETAYLEKTIPTYYKEVDDQPDTPAPRVSFHDGQGNQDIVLENNYFFRGYGNFWRIFYPCVNVDQAGSRIYVSGSYTPTCLNKDVFNSSDISTCTGTGDHYCSDSMTSVETETGLGLTLKEYQESIVWVRSVPSFRSCKDILDQGYSYGNGIYLIDPDGAQGTDEPFKTYCEMSKNGGGWTLVWSNTREGTNKPTTGLDWTTSTTTRPRCSESQGSGATDSSGDCSWMTPSSISAGKTHLEMFNYYLGLDFWTKISESRDFQMMYQWSHDYLMPIDYESVFQLEAFDADYTLKLSNLYNRIGTLDPGIWSTHNNRKWSTLDVDNDVHAGSACGTNYSNTPFWYDACWSGSFNGGGETDGLGYFNGAYWRGSAKAWGATDGSGAGNGWIFIREIENKTSHYKRSCRNILEDNPSAASGYYYIKSNPLYSDPIRVYCDMDRDGGGWTLIFRHVHAGGLWTDEVEAMANLSVDNDPYDTSKYTRLRYIKDLRADGKFTFRIEWPGYSEINIWSQTTDPTVDQPVAGYQAIDVDVTSNSWGGLERNCAVDCLDSFIDGSVNSTNWYYAIGSFVDHGSPPGIPANATTGQNVEEVILWIK